MDAALQEESVPIIQNGVSSGNGKNETLKCIWHVQCIHQGYNIPSRKLYHFFGAKYHFNFLTYYM